MEVRFDKALRDMDGNELHDKVPSGEKNVLGQDIMIDGPVATLGAVSVNALVATYQDEQRLSGEDKVKRWELAMRIKKLPSGAADLTAEEVALIKSLIAKAYGPIIVGQAWAMLEGKL